MRCVVHFFLSTRFLPSIWIHLKTRMQWVTSVKFVTISTSMRRASGGYRDPSYPVGLQAERVPEIGILRQCLDMSLAPQVASVTCDSTQFWRVTESVNQPWVRLAFTCFFDTIGVGQVPNAILIYRSSGLTRSVDSSITGVPNTGEDCAWPLCGRAGLRTHDRSVRRSPLGTGSNDLTNSIAGHQISL